MTATLPRPSCNAACACAIWNMKEEPPRIVVSMKVGEMPRYSASDRPEVRLCAVAHSRPSMSRSRRPQSASARWTPCAIRSIGLMSRATAPRSDSATPMIAAAPRCSPSITRPLPAPSLPPTRLRGGVGGGHRCEDGIGRLVTARTVDAEFDAHADLHRLGRDVLDPAHQPETLIAIDQRDIVGHAFARMHDGRRIDCAEPGAHPPFEPVAAGKRGNDTGIEHGLCRLGTPLVGQLALFEMRLIDRQR